MELLGQPVATHGNGFGLRAMWAWTWTCTAPPELAPALLELPGCGAVTAAKLLAEIGPIDRFKSDAQLARNGGVAPLEASSGRVQRHRLDRGGNRQLNAALDRIVITQSHYHPSARAYLERKQAEGKSAKRSAA